MMPREERVGRARIGRYALAHRLGWFGALS